VSGTVILTGAPGAGKSSVLDALATMLEIDRVPFGAIESESLARGWPWPRFAEWIPQLAAVAGLQRAAGRDTFIVVATTKTQSELDAVLSAVGGDPLVVICLSAPADVVAGRIAEREPDSWPGKAGLIAHARHLAARIPALPGVDLVLRTDGRQAAEVADAIKQAAAARGIWV
jgi:chloramphenicol 3-O-phosphotransferase